MKQAIEDRKLLEQQQKKLEAVAKTISAMEDGVTSAGVEIKTLDEQIVQSNAAEEAAKTANDAAGAKEQQKLRGKLEQTATKRKAELKQKQAHLDAKRKQRDNDPLQSYANKGMVNISKDVVEAMTGAGLHWGGSWEGAKEFMHFEL